MSTASLVAKLLESDEPFDPKAFAMRTPNALERACAWAVEEFFEQISRGSIYSAETADQCAAAIAQDACVKFSLEDNDDYEAVVTPLFTEAGEQFPDL